MTLSGSSLPASATAAQQGFDPARAVRLAQETLDIEAAALQGLKARLGESFPRVVQAMLQVRGRVVVSGIL